MDQFLLPKEGEEVPLSENIGAKEKDELKGQGDSFIPSEVGEATKKVKNMTRKTYTALDLCKTKVLVKNTLIIFYCW